MQVLEEGHHTVVVTKDGASFAFGSNKEVGLNAC